jgi:hypothetical protein
VTGLDTAHGGGKVVTFDKSAAKLEFFELLG